MYSRLISAVFCGFILNLVNSENCRYEFVVPNSPGVTCAKDPSQMSTDLLDNYVKGIAKAEAEAHVLEQQTAAMKSRLADMDETIKSVQSLNSQLQQIMNNQSLPTILQDKMATISKAYQKQSAAQFSIYQDLQSKMAIHEEMVLNHTNQINGMKNELPNPQAGPDSKNASKTKSNLTMTNLAAKVQNLESTLLTDPPIPDSLKRLTTAVNMLQNVTLSRSLRQQVKVLQNQMQGVQAYLNKLQGAIMIGK